MKILISALLSFLCFSSFAQNLELEFAKRFGSIAEDRYHSLSVLEHYEEYGLWLIAGRFSQHIDIGINSTEILTSESSMGFVALYSENFDLEYSFLVDATILSAALDQEQVVLTGLFFYDVDFDLNSEENEIYSTNSSLGNGYLASYELDGQFNWVNIFSSETTNNAGRFCYLEDNRIFTVCYYAGSQFGGPFTFVQEEGVEIVLESPGGGSCILFEFDTDGSYVFHHQFSSPDDLVEPVDIKFFENQLFLSLRVREGYFNLGITEDVVFELSFSGNSIVCAFDIEDYSLSQYHAFTATSENSGVGRTYFSNLDSNGALFTFGYSGTIDMSSNQLGSNTQLNSDESLNSIGVVKLENENVNFSRIESTESMELKGCYALGNLDFLIALDYEDHIAFNEVILDTESFESTGLLYVNNDLSGVSLNKFNNSFMGTVNPRALEVTSNNEFYLAGFYEENPDFDFSTEDTDYLGDTDDRFVGFLTRYSYGPFVGINYKGSIELSAYPSPAKSTLNLEGDHLKPLDHFEIVDQSGRIVLEGTISAHFTIDVSRLKSGIYLLKLDHSSFRFIK